VDEANSGGREPGRKNPDQRERESSTRQKRYAWRRCVVEQETQSRASRVFAGQSGGRDGDRRMPGKQKERTGKFVSLRRREGVTVCCEFASATIHTDEIHCRKRQEVNKERKSRRNQLVAATRVTALVKDSRSEFWVAEAVERTLGNDDHWMPDAS
jgi:predicted nucleic acid-binding Zn ribbon protein